MVSNEQAGEEKEPDFIADALTALSHSDALRAREAFDRLTPPCRRFLNQYFTFYFASNGCSCRTNIAFDETAHGHSFQNCIGTPTFAP